MRGAIHNMRAGAPIGQEQLDQGAGGQLVHRANALSRGAALHHGIAAPQHRARIHDDQFGARTAQAASLQAHLPLNSQPSAARQVIHALAELAEAAQRRLATQPGAQGIASLAPVGDVHRDQVGEPIDTDRDLVP